MNLSTTNLVLAPDAAIDFQMHTTYSDGSWHPEQLLDHLLSEKFELAAITDHDQPASAIAVQQLAIEKGMPVLLAVEMTTFWNGQMMDILCFGFDPNQQALTDLAKDLIRRQEENTREVYENLCRKGYIIPQGSDELRMLLDMPSPQQPHALVALVKKNGHATGEPSAGKIVLEAGCTFATNDPEAVVSAAHGSGAVCILAHPGREDGFVCFDVPLLGQLRQNIPIDGLEVYYPVHTPEQTSMYQEYARKHQLLISAGSDSHGPENKPIKYRADQCKDLLERLDIQLS
jgi:Predicted metal-dependent phosphoesterases (PHP family)